MVKKVKEYDIYKRIIEGVEYELYDYGYSEVEQKEIIHIFDSKKFYLENEINAIPDLKDWYDSFALAGRMIR